METILWKQYYGNNIMETISWKQYHGNNIMETISWKQYHGNMNLIHKFPSHMADRALQQGFLVAIQEVPAPVEQECERFFRIEFLPGSHGQRHPHHFAVRSGKPGGQFGFGHDPFVGLQIKGILQNIKDRFIKTPQ